MTRSKAFLGTATEGSTARTEAPPSDPLLTDAIESCIRQLEEAAINDAKYHNEASLFWLQVWRGNLRARIAELRNP